MGESKRWQGDDGDEEWVARESGERVAERSDGDEIWEEEKPRKRASVWRIPQWHQNRIPKLGL